MGATTVPASATPTSELFPTPPRQDARILGYRTLGRTGWRVSDIGMGTVPLRDADVVRYAYDKGVNYFDTAEGYGNGAAERAIGDAMQQYANLAGANADRCVDCSGYCESACPYDVPVPTLLARAHQNLMLA